MTFQQRYFRVVATGAGGGESGGEPAMRATLASIGSFVDRVPRTNTATWKARILEHLLGRADIDSAGDMGDGVWAITTDGIPLSFWNNRLADPPAVEDPFAFPALARTEVPGNTTARFAVTVGAGFRQSAPALARMVAAKGYRPVADNASLSSLKGSRNESIFFYNTHGGDFFIPLFGADGNPLRGTNNLIRYEIHYGLWTGQKIDPNLTDPNYRHQEFLADLRAKRLAIAYAPAFYITGTGGFQSAVNEWRFGITAEWVKHYMRFPLENHASVWLGACLSGSPEAAAMRAAFLSVGADMVSGWTDNVHGDAVYVATAFVWDRLLGANIFQPPATPQRPFDYDEVWTELRSKGLHTHPTRDRTGTATVTDIIYQGKPGEGTFGLFAPSIAYVLVDERENKAVLHGIFGKPPADKQKVTIGGSEASVHSWEPRKIVCALAQEGAGSAGDVQVEVDGRKSNVRQISRWTVTGTYKYRGDNPQHQVEGSVRVIFRADIGEYRVRPGNVFVRPTRYAEAAQKSKILLKATGVVREPCGDNQNTVETWFGEGDWPSATPDSPVLTLSMLRINTIDQSGAFAMAFGFGDPDQTPLKVRFEPCDAPPLVLPLPLAWPFFTPEYFSDPLEETGAEFPLVGKPITFGSDWTIPAGSSTTPFKSGIDWNAAGVEFPPITDAAR